MSPVELRASMSLASIFGLRLLGMFVILPVFAIYAEGLAGGHDLMLVGFAIGAYGLTQALLQIPFGWFSDRYGRKRVIYVGLLIFATGSFVAALANSIHVVILGRVLQGAGAISAAVMALAADLTREEQHSKAMAMIGSTIGVAFALSLILSPWLNARIGVPGIFWMTGILALTAMMVVWRLVPDVDDYRAHASRGSSASRAFSRVLRDPQLARLNYGVFALHAALMSLFVAVPFALRDAGSPLAEHWKIYLPVMLGSFVLMLPAVMGEGRTRRMKAYFTGSVALLVLAHLALPWLSGSVWLLAAFLLLFFAPFNVLEALLPTLTSKLAPPGSKGTAIGLYSSVQFFGTFLGAVLGGYVYGRWALQGVIVLNAALLATWLAIAAGMRTPVPSSTRTYTLPRLNARQAQALTARLQLLPGVRLASVVAAENRAYLEVDSMGFDEHNVLQLIARET